MCVSYCPDFTRGTQYVSCWLGVAYKNRNACVQWHTISSSKPLCWNKRQQPRRVQRNSLTRLSRLLEAQLQIKSKAMRILDNHNLLSHCCVLPEPGAYNSEGFPVIFLLVWRFIQVMLNLITMEDTNSHLSWRFCDIIPSKTIKFQIDSHLTLTLLEWLVVSSILRVRWPKFSQRTFLSRQVDLITLSLAAANALLIFTHTMAVMRLRITSRTPSVEVEMLLQRED